MDKPNIRIGIFLGISLIWSLIWFSQWSQLNVFFSKIPPITVLFFGLVPTFGLAIGRMFLQKNIESKKMTITGGNSVYSLIILSIPVICLAIIGIENRYGIQKNIFGTLIGIFTFLYAFLEEYGWRGYLQEELNNKFNKWITYLFIGVIWYLWHWYFLREGNNPKLIMIPILIGASVGIGEIAKSTKSILICAAFHGIVNILIIYNVIAANLSTNQKIIILIASLIVWIPIIKIIEKENTATNING